MALFMKSNDFYDYERTLAKKNSSILILIYM